MENGALSIDIAVVIGLVESPLKIHLKNGEIKQIPVLIITINIR